MTISASDQQNAAEVPETTAKEVLRLSELYLDGTLKIALAADTRAMQLAGLCSTAASGLLLFGFGNATHALDFDVAASVAAFSSAVVFYVAVVLSLRAAAPRDVYISGNILSEWKPDELTGPLRKAMMSQAKQYDEAAWSNIDLLTANGKFVKNALRVMAAAPIVALISGAVAFFRAPIAAWIVFLYVNPP